jgi:hypothetical protein
MPILALAWDGEDVVLLCVCIGAGVIACIFFISIFIADAREAKRRADEKKSFERAREFFVSGPDASQADDPSVKSAAPQKARQTTIR